ncbi:MAG: putative Werner helicase interacting protein 1, partial [Streblomastix strix]
RGGEYHHDYISAMHKSIRGGDANASIYYIACMLHGGETPRYIARRLIRVSIEDVGIADPAALPLAISCWDACEYIGSPECELALATTAVYLARAPKSIEVYQAFDRARAFVSTHRPEPVPMQIRNAPTKLMEKEGYGRGYVYTPLATPEENASQTYLPEALQKMGVDFFQDKDYDEEQKQQLQKTAMWIQPSKKKSGK